MMTYEPYGMISQQHSEIPTLYICYGCGAAVADQKVHDTWHDDQYEMWKEVLR